MPQTTPHLVNLIPPGPPEQHIFVYNVPRSLQENISRYLRNHLTDFLNFPRPISPTPRRLRHILNTISPRVQRYTVFLPGVTVALQVSRIHHRVALNKRWRAWRNASSVQLGILKQENFDSYSHRHFQIAIQIFNLSKRNEIRGDCWNDNSGIGDKRNKKYFARNEQWNEISWEILCFEERFSSCLVFLNFVTNSSGRF